jgi:hypothetical protein
MKKNTIAKSSKPVPVKIVSGGDVPFQPSKPVTRTVTTSNIVKDALNKPIKIYGELVIDPKSKSAHFEHQHYDEKKGCSVIDKVPVQIEKKK